MAPEYTAPARSAARTSKRSYRTIAYAITIGKSSGSFHIALRYGTGVWNSASATVPRIGGT